MWEHLLPGIKGFASRENALIYFSVSAYMNLAIRVARRYLERRAHSRRALIVPPRRLPLFVKNFEKEVAQRFERVKQALTALDSDAKKNDQWNELSKILKSLKLLFLSRIESGMRQHTTDIDFAFHNFTRSVPSSSLRITDPIAKPLIEVLERALDKEGSYAGFTLREVANNLVHLERFTWNEMDEEGLKPDVLSALETVGDEVQSLVRLIDAKLIPLRAFTTGDVKPEATETLYHASVKARSIYQQGFQVEMPKDQIGLGGSQEAKNGIKGISFTYDLRAALDIARSFKEAAMIATGQIKASQVLDWGLREGDMETFMIHLNAKTKRQFRGLVHNGSKWILSVRHIGSPDIEMNIDEAMNEPIDVFNIYDPFLYTQKSRVNPIHMNRYELLKFLKDADPKDIGVIAVEVDMSHPGVGSFSGEREFRVPPPAIRRVLKFYGS